MQIGEHYYVLHELGRGGMGIVNLAIDTRLERKVAIKQLYRESGQQQITSHLLNEAKILAKLNHPHIVQIYDVIDTSQQCALVMEYVDGTTLQHYLREHVISLRQRLLWLVQITEGLAAAHQANIIHRDLKAENILIDNKCTAKITDFGIAWRGNEHISQNRSVVGSYHAMSPEQALGLSLDNRSDLFSLGILIYQLLCGEHPFDSRHNRATALEHMLDIPHASAKQLNPQLPVGLVALIDQLLEKKRSNRPRNTNEVATTLRKYIARLPADNTTDTRTVTLPISTTSIVKGREKQKTNNAVSIELTIKRKILLVGCCLLMTILYWQLIKTPDTRYVAVLPPVIKADKAITQTQQKLIKTTIYHALQQSIIALSGLQLIASSEVESISGSNSLIGKAVGADELIHSTVQCNNERCDIKVVKLGGVRWSVLEQKQWPMLFNNVLAITEITQQKMALLYHRRYGIEPLSDIITENDYRIYLSLYQDSLVDSKDKQNMLKAVAELQRRAPRFASLYTLYRNIALELYKNTQEQYFLDKLEAFLSVGDRYVPTIVSQHINHFWLALERGRYKNAKQHIKYLQNLHTDNAVIAQLTASLYLQEGKYPEAITAYNHSLRLRPNRRVFYDLAVTQWSGGYYDDAKLTLTQLFKLSPEDYFGQQFSATIALMQGDLDRSISIYQKILLLNPQAVNKNNLGLAYMLQGQYAMARTQFKLAVENNPQNSTWLLNLADAEQLIGNQQQAKQHYKKLLTLLNNRSDWESLLLKALSYVQIGKYHFAIRDIQHAQRLVPGNTEVYFNAALIYALVGEFTSALVQVQNALDNGISAIWFRLPWFDSLCQYNQFNQLLNDAGELHRCQPVN